MERTFVKLIVFVKLYHIQTKQSQCLSRCIHCLQNKIFVRLKVKDYSGCIPFPRIKSALLAGEGLLDLRDLPHISDMVFS